MSAENNDKFDKEMKALFKTLQNVIDFKLKQNVLASSANPIYKFMNRYIKAYGLTRPDEHHVDVLDVYNKFKLAIHKSALEDEWLLKDLVVLKYGDNPKIEMKIMLSSIYSDAYKIKQDTLESIKGLPEEAADGRKELLFCDWIRLHLYRLFYECVPETEKKKVLELIIQLESEMGVETPSGGKANVTDPNNPLAGIVNMMQPMLAQMGVNIPSDVKMPSMNEIGTLFSSVFANPQAQNVIGQVMRDANIAPNTSSTTTSSAPQQQQAPDMAGMFQNLMRGFTDPNFASTLGTAMSPPAAVTTPQVPVSIEETKEPEQENK